MQDQPTQMHEVKAVAGLLNVHVSTIYRLIKTGQLKAEKFGTRKGLRVEAASLAAYRATREVAAVTAETPDEVD